MKKTKVTFSSEKLNVSSSVLRALAHPLRLKILQFIDANDGINVNKIYNTLQIEQSITSQHLRIMRNAGVLQTSKQGKFVFYNIDYPTVSRAEKAVNTFLGK